MKTVEVVAEAARNRSDSAVAQMKGMVYHGPGRPAWEDKPRPTLRETGDAIVENPDRAGRTKLYVKRVFITDDAEMLPRYLRFVRGVVDSADLPLNVSREKIQESPLLAAIKKGVTSRIFAELERLADKEPPTYAKIWDVFGAVLKEGIYEDFERREVLLKLARFKTTASDDWRSLKDYVAALRPNQTAIYYIAGDDLARLNHRRIWKVSAPVASKYCCSPIRSTRSGSCRAPVLTASRSSR